MNKIVIQYTCAVLSECFRNTHRLDTSSKQLVQLIGTSLNVEATFALLLQSCRSHEAISAILAHEDVGYYIFDLICFSIGET